MISLIFSRNLLMRYFFQSIMLFFIITFIQVEADQKWQRIYLASYPRSGNHWLRSLLEEATRIATSSVYLDKEPMHLESPFPWGGFSCDHGLEGNCRYPEKGEIVVIKTHYPAKNKKEYDLKPSIKIIRIVRHPLDAFYSHALHHPSCGELPKDGKVPHWFVERSIKNWLKFEQYWNGQRNVLTIRYEDLLNNIDVHFREILEAIGYELSEEDINRAIEKFPPQEHKEMQHLDNFHFKDLCYISFRLNQLMIKYGYKIPLNY